ncbi:hypothetical protein BRYFOR_06730 [Marvinbryantia formatexigens DSM 14469]|uniref:Uncharacterized protein n=1 Tax=Marvinbryantia formatexigens DSM 14469 TaxID=478749 RepID=C6LDN2_9FIRM|nr:hypothetical protein BRYFOR_06730 [Marvinbryantia formatexigens DSM 14469]
MYTFITFSESAETKREKLPEIMHIFLLRENYYTNLDRVL